MCHGFVKCLNDIFLFVLQFRSSGGWMCPKSSRDAKTAPGGGGNRSQRGGKITPGGVQNRPWGCPAKVQKHMSPKKNRHPWKVSRKWLQNGTPNRKVGDIVGDLFRYFPASFLGLLFNCFFKDLGNVFCINFMLYLDMFGYFFETSCFG